MGNNKNVLLVMVLMTLIPGCVETPEEWAGEDMKEPKPVPKPTTTTTLAVEVDKGAGWDRACQDGKCTMSLYSGVRNVFEDRKWKPVKEARSLKDKGFNIVYLEKDPDYELEVVDFNYTAIQIKTSVTKNKDKNKNIPVKLWKIKHDEMGKNVKGLKKEKKVKFNRINDKKLITIEYDNPLDFELHFGENSTTIMLQDADTENLGDLNTWKLIPGNNYGGESSIGFWNDGPYHKTAYLMFNISGISGTVTDSQLCLYQYSRGSANNCPIGVYHILDHTWDGQTESTMTWTNQVCGTNFDDSTDCNLTALDTINLGDDAPLWRCWDVTIGVKRDVDASYENTSFAFYDGGDTSANDVNMYSKEYGTDITLRPYLNVTHTAVTTTTTTSTTTTTIPAVVANQHQKIIRTEDNAISGIILSGLLLIGGLKCGKRFYS